MPEEKIELSQIFCKNCGIQLNILKAANGVIGCKACNSVFTVVKKDISPIALQFLRMGEHDLDTGDFDGAYDAYAKAAEYDRTEPEAYWGMALAQMQVVYLKDEFGAKDGKKNGRLQPICYAFDGRNFSENENYNRALKFATPEQKKIYVSRAEEIDYIKKEFRRLHDEEELDYDCFICVKVSAVGEDEEGGNNRKKTEDSKYAREIYDMLVDYGFETFYSEEVLKNVTGNDYEAHILYALATAESMLVVCFNEDYLHTKWVKNEFTRFLKLSESPNKSGNGLTVVYKGKPVERLPGRVGGAIQGIDVTDSKYKRNILDFVKEHTPGYQRKREKEKLQKEKYEQYAAQMEQINQERKALDETSRKMQETLEEIRKAQSRSTSTSRSAVSATDSFLQTAYASVNAANYDEARVFFNSILRNTPNCAEAWWGLFLCDIRCNDYNEVFNDLNKTRRATIAQSVNLKYAEQCATGELQATIFDFKARYAKALSAIRDSLAAEIANQQAESAITDQSYYETLNEQWEKLKADKAEYEALRASTNQLHSKLENMRDYAWFRFNKKAFKISFIVCFVVIAIILALCTLSEVAFRGDLFWFWGPQVAVKLLLRAFGGGDMAVDDPALWKGGEQVTIFFKLVSLVGCLFEALIYGFLIVLIGWLIYTVVRLLYVIPYNCSMKNASKKYGAQDQRLEEMRSNISFEEIAYDELQRDRDRQNKDSSNSIVLLQNEIQMIQSYMDSL